MNYLKTTVQRYKDLLMRYPGGSVLLLVLVILILSYSYHTGALVQAAAYLCVMGLCVFVIDLVVGFSPLNTPALVIKNPVKKELAVILICTFLGLVFFCIRFLSDWQHMQGLPRILTMLLVVFAFPVVLALIFLMIFKYKFRELGISLHYWYLPLALHLIWGGTTLLLIPGRSHFAEIVAEYGIIGFIVTGILGAALSEEFTRMLILTRIGAASNMFVGLFVAACIWSAMHLPVSYSQDPLHFGWIEASMGVVNLIPLGLLWGYLTYRTQSLIPVLLMHGFNLWGLQNF